MRNILTALALSTVTVAAQASEPQHFKGKVPTSYEEAQTNLMQGNADLAKIVEDGKVTPVEMGEIHQLTYTLENALEYMEEEIERVQELLEEVHQGSEKGTNAQVLRDSKRYIQQSKVLQAQ